MRSSPSTTRCPARTAVRRRASRRPAVRPGPRRRPPPAGAAARNMDALIGFYAGVGLTLADAYRACMETIRLVVGFVEFEDALRDRTPAHLDPADLEAHPPPWLRTGDEGGGLPHLVAVAGLVPDSADTRFAFAVDVFTAGVAARVGNTP
ncbi:TetR/AcrR family transcriptional regulator C-terminal domain-containing protein [Streptomyces sp. NPDC088387]|uniref:TetR/AcrR family transcriptional regulator C-terminal domain-containing protein n=1 Tax=Streptomyces sp. NPDC088387 TaxID=3365859 RepID=UPI003814FAB3